MQTWLEMVSVESVTSLRSQDLRQMHAEQKRVGEDNGCSKSNVNSLYWIINIMHFTILILHILSVSRFMVFPLIFCRKKNPGWFLPVMFVISGYRANVQYVDSWVALLAFGCINMPCSCHLTWTVILFKAWSCYSWIYSRIPVNLKQYAVVICSNQCSMGTHTEKKKQSPRGVGSLRPWIFLSKSLFIHGRHVNKMHRSIPVLCSLVVKSHFYIDIFNSNILHKAGRARDDIKQPFEFCGFQLELRWLK